MAKEYKFLYGPVRSRRLGLSLGVDIVPPKVCTLDCIYCQIGLTTQKTLQRAEYLSIDAVMQEIKARITEPLTADFITIGGSGEPTLNSGLGRLIDQIRQITDIPVAILTNGTLFYRQDVRADCAAADVVLPSLDAGDEETFDKINRPHPDISLEKLVSGLAAFRTEFAGRIWLEVFLVDGINTAPAQLTGIREAIDRIRPDKVQLNTAVRPTAEAGLKRLSTERLQALAKSLGKKCELVPDAFTKPCGSAGPQAASDRLQQRLLSILKRRPCSLAEICSALKISQDNASRYLSRLQMQGIVGTEQREDTIFFKPI